MPATVPGTDITCSKSAIVKHAHAHGPAPVGKVPSNDLNNHEGKGENERQNELFLYLQRLKAHPVCSLELTPCAYSLQHLVATCTYLAAFLSFCLSSSEDAGATAFHRCKISADRANSSMLQSVKPHAVAIPESPLSSEPWPRGSSLSCRSAMLVSLNLSAEEQCHGLRVAEAETAVCS